MEPVSEEYKLKTCLEVARDEIRRYKDRIQELEEMIIAREKSTTRIIEQKARLRKALEEIKKYIVKITCIEGEHIVIGLNRKEVLFVYSTATEALKEGEGK